MSGVLHLRCSGGLFGIRRLSPAASWGKGLEGVSELPASSSSLTISGIDVFL